MNQRILQRASHLFEWIERWWEGHQTQRAAGTALVITFLVSLVVLDLNIRGWLPNPLASVLPKNHFYAVEFAFTLLLLFEVLSLIFVLERSVSSAVGKQIEILSLILLRLSFKQFIYFDEPIRWEQVRESLVPMVSDAVGALLIFVALGFYYRLQRHIPITTDADEQASFVAAKRLVALVLLVAFFVIGFGELFGWVSTGRIPTFFDQFFTVLIFTDVLIVLISLRYSSTYHVVFRNSGYALATVFIRLALISPPPFNAALGLGVVVFAVGLTVAYNTMLPVPQREARIPYSS
ncbi:MAG: hypothetical protein H7Z42_10570 [Roseiflexaceae bacterium]|nr:hypothetical protein [Roseiflexaceae bacterium]